MKVKNSHKEGSEHTKQWAHRSLSHTRLKTCRASFIQEASTFGQVCPATPPKDQHLRQQYRQTRTPEQTLLLGLRRQKRNVQKKKISEEITRIVLERQHGHDKLPRGHWSDRQCSNSRLLAPGCSLRIQWMHFPSDSHKLKT